MPLLEDQKPMRTITLEEHYATPAFMEGPGRRLKEQAQAARAHPEVAAGFARLLDQLCDLDELRIADMDAAGIDVQVLSLTSPGVDQLDATAAALLARDSNDHLAKATRRYPSRFAGFATLPTAAPDTAADELERAVRKLNFKGALINGHLKGRYLDDQFFWPILERAEALKVPLYLHPTLPPEAVIAASYTGNFAPGVVVALSSAAWGWHIETAIHVLRLILGGAFDQYPSLQLIIGHLGETLPFMLQRLDLGLPPQMTKLERPISAYLREDLHYTFSGFNYTAPFLDLLLEVGVDRIMFSADYPYSSMEDAQAFLDRLPLSPA
ncbi:MAG: amidohydrolase family protein, partial [Halobacteriota archaeon]